MVPLTGTTFSLLGLDGEMQLDNGHLSGPSTLSITEGGKYLLWQIEPKLPEPKPLVARAEGVPEKSISRTWCFNKVMPVLLLRTPPGTSSSDWRMTPGVASKGGCKQHLKSARVKPA